MAYVRRNVRLGWRSKSRVRNSQNFRQLQGRASLRKSGSLFANRTIKFQGQPTANKQRQTVLLKYPEEQELLKVLKGQKIPFWYTLFTEKHKDLRYLGNSKYGRMAWTLRSMRTRLIN